MITEIKKTNRAGSSLTTGNEFQTIILFAIPFVLQNLAQQMYSFIDGLVAIKYLGMEPFAAIGSVSSLIHLLRSFGMGLMNGTSIILAQAVGKKHHNNIESSISILLQIAVFFSVIITLVGCFGCERFIVLLKIPMELVPYASEYLSIILMGTLFSFTTNAIASIYKAYGNSKTPLIIMCFSLSLNLIMDYYFVKKIHMGICGIAFATVFSEGIALIASFFILKRTIIPHQKINLLVVHPRNDYKNCMIYGIPSALQLSLVQIGFTLNQGVINSFGATTITAISAASKIESFASLGMTNIGTAMTTYSAQNYGAQQNERITSGYKKMRTFIICFSVLEATILYIFAKPLLCVFLNPQMENYSEIIAQGCTYLKTIGTFLFLFGLISVTNGTLRGIGNVLITAIGAVASLGTRLLVALLLKNLNVGPASIWIAVPIGWLAGLSITSVRINHVLSE